jgi:spore germination protein YaaH
MKRFGFFVIVVVVMLALVLLLRSAKEKVRRDLAQPVAYPSVTVVPTHEVDSNAKTQNSLFVPYWTLKSDIEAEKYDSFIYFGISPKESGIDMEEAGAANVDTFLEKVPAGKKKLLAIRMINTQTNLAILKDPTKQKKIIAETIAFAKQHDFDGVVLDLEISAIPFDSLIQQISSLTKGFYTQAKKNYLSFGMTFYGDTFYRIRPFDVKVLAKNTDEIYVMTYDFHKSNGNPGPNFPLQGKDKYGYDMDKMVDTFLQFAPSNKVTVIFGLFGYDWVVDKQGKALEKGQPLTDHEIQQKFLTDCLYTNCSVRHDKESAETEVRYKDEEGKDHRVWFEDMSSVAAKKAYLKKKGISSFSFWANSYF